MSVARQARSLLVAAVVVTASVSAMTLPASACQARGNALVKDVTCLVSDSQQSSGSGTAAGSTASTGGGGGSVTHCYYGQLRLPCSVVAELERLRGTCAPVENPGDCPVVAVVTSPVDEPPADPAAPAAEIAAPVAVAMEAIASMRLRAIDMQITPAPLSANPESMGLVGLPVWMWTDATPETWGPNTASATAGSVSITVTAKVERIEWEMGDGTVVRCTTSGTPFDPEVHGVEDRSPDCGHVYERTSRRQPSGAYTVTATSYWVADWSDDEGESGTIPFELTASEQMRIGEMHVLRTSRAS